MRVIAAMIEAISINENYIKESYNWSMAYTWKNMPWNEHLAFRIDFFFAAIM